MSVDKTGLGINKSEVEILIGIYDALSDLRVKVGENAAKHESSEQHIGKIERKLEDIDNKLNRLSVSEAQTSLKFGIITFFATLLSVSGINYALSQGEMRITGLPAQQKMDITPRNQWDNDRED
jgi:hypothetical protein